MADSFNLYDLIDPAFLSEGSPATPALDSLTTWDFLQTTEDDYLFSGLDEFNGSIDNDLTGIGQGGSLLEPISTSLPDTAHDASAASSSAIPANSLEPESKPPVDQSPSASRFTSSTIRTLRSWFLKHDEHPYPNSRQIETLQNQTNLTKKQITNWFANARRRYRTRPQRYSSPFLGDVNAALETPVSAAITPLEIPPRRPTPAPFGSMNPLQRWQNSPPEDEAAAINDISRALNASGELVPSNRSHSAVSSGNASSVDSGGTSRSSRSRGYWSDSSAFSQALQKSAQDSNRQKLKVRRRRHPTSQRNYRNRLVLVGTVHTFQCTFCTETFKSKYDWQRHEKSLHVSFEKWICSPNGPVVPGEKGLTCAYCGQPDPDPTHLDGHHDIECSERPLKDRTFYRKDHLRQHLKLVHDCKYIDSIMQEWQVTKQDIKSRCGFCGADIATWTDRVNHLASHFKAGSTMADWKGDWGFESHINEIIENSMPPYLIHLDQNSPLPFTVVNGPVSPTSAYELLKLEVEFYVGNHFDITGCLPSDQETQLEACCVIFGADIKSHVLPSTAPSWLRDVIMSSPEISSEASMRPTNRSTRARFTQLIINGKASIFETCTMELRLRKFLSAQSAMGVSVSDRQLQEEAASIAVLADSAWQNSSKRFVDFLIRLIWSSTDWLLQVRERAELDPIDGIPGDDGRLNMMSIGSGTANPACFGVLPLRDDSDTSRGLHQGGATTNSLPDDTLNSVLAPDPVLNRDRTHAESLASWNNSINVSMLTTGLGCRTDNLGVQSRASAKVQHAHEHKMGPGHSSVLQTVPLSISAFSAASIQEQQQGPRDQGQLHNSCNCYWALRRELFRFTIRTMSPNNPNCHVPSDDELRYQARWIWCEDDDPWEHTPADSEEWLRDFKRDAGISVDVEGVVQAVS